MSSTMTLTHVQPRRRAARTSDTTATTTTAASQQQTLVDLDIPTDLSVRKGLTFHHPKSPSTPSEDPVINIKGLPSRSLTCPKSLEVLQDQSDRIVNDILTSFDRSLSGLGVAGAEAKDSIVGSVLGGGKQANNGPTTTTAKAAAAGGHTVKTSVYAPVSKRTTFPSSHVLSEYAAKVIKLHIIDPILDEAALKDFHPLVKGLPQRIGSSQVRCLRDLEKVLIFLAPHAAKSARSYLDFCETSIQCIVSTVDHLNETDQRRPNDRPYTNNYFVDLVEQVRQYARIMAVSRAKQAKGLPLDDSDLQPGEKVVLRGGVGDESGKPIELVREVDGKFVPIPADEIDLDDGVFDDDVSRSMARKRKCDIGKVEYRACRECGKVYTRPCDLTKHEKTHSRPWKCSEEGCKYYEFGWPTEKERDRHMNDKHSRAPALYHCLWAEEGCTYTSKRESNCKQHMEKAHGWDYVRSKSKNGTKLVPTSAAPASASAASPSASVPSLMPTPASERLPTPALTVSSNQSPAPSTLDAYSPDDSHGSNYSRGASMSSYHPSPYAPSPSSSEPAFNFNDYGKDFNSYDVLSPNPSELQADAFKVPSAANLGGDVDMTTFEQEFKFNNVNTDWNVLGSLFPQYQIPHQQPTPIGSDYGLDFDMEPSKSISQSVASEFSPGASSNAMLFGSEDVMMQESQGFVDFAAQAKAGQQQQQQQPQPADFTLFGEVTGGFDGADTAAAMFPDLGEESHFEQEMNATMFDQMSEEEMDRYLYGDGH